ncbi:MAG: RND transporter [Bacteroidetes bacterium]|nr:MAG: RND transporter [Bacteroidota bacterium]
MKKRSITVIVIIILLLSLIVYFFMPDKKKAEAVLTTVAFGDFTTSITTTGELEAQKSEKIHGPNGLNRFRIWQVKINNMVPDGTIVDSGDWVADLDRTELINKKNDLETELDKLTNQYAKTRLDTSMTLRQAREDIINIRYAKEEAKIKYDQSQYEPPATIRQIKIDMEKTERKLKQTEKNYQLKLKRAQADVNEVLASLNQKKRKYENLQKILAEFSVKAPKSGMLIYRRDWDGQKQGIGSQVNVGWNNVVAELPDLSKMRTRTYVNEVDVSKVKVGQEVNIGIDAFPNRIYQGKVESVANIGQQMRSSNAKVFEVIINLIKIDSILRPAMTTKNEIITGTFSDVLYVPLDAIQNTDSLTYVITANNKRKEVLLGHSNDNHIIVKKGLEKDEEIYLLPPEGYEDFTLINLEK